MDFQFMTEKDELKKIKKYLISLQFVGKIGKQFQKFYHYWNLIKKIIIIILLSFWWFYANQSRSKRKRNK